MHAPADFAMVSFSMSWDSKGQSTSPLVTTQPHFESTGTPPKASIPSHLPFYSGHMQYTKAVLSLSRFPTLGSKETGTRYLPVAPVSKLECPDGGLYGLRWNPHRYSHTRPRSHLQMYASQPTCAAESSTSASVQLWSSRFPSARVSGEWFPLEFRIQGSGGRERRNTIDVPLIQILRSPRRVLEGVLGWIVPVRNVLVEAK